MDRPRARRLRITFALLGAGCLAGAGIAGASTRESAAATMPAGPAWVVSVGDSYISGEAGRWAGNTDQPEYRDIDALGSSAYDEDGSAATIAGCHRSHSAEISIGGASSLNLACSGASTSTTPYTGGAFKPGLDFYSDGQGHDGQALALENFAASHRVTMVAVSIGGNNFGFASVARACVQDFLLSSALWKNYCHDDPSVSSRFTAAAVTDRTSEIRQSLLHVRQAMTDSGYADTDYAIVVQTYPSPLPRAGGLRYGEFGYGRQVAGGCGFWNGDLNWADSTAVPAINQAVRDAATGTGLPNVRILDVSTLLDGHRLCENGVGKLYEKHLGSWKSAGAADQSEWVQNVRTITAAGSPFYLQESLHPNHWGQFALRNCLRQAYNGGAVRGGTCTTVATGLNGSGEPNTRLTAT